MCVLNTYMCLCMCVHVCLYVEYINYVCLVVWYSDTDSLVRSGVFAVKLIHWRFEDWPAGRFGDTYRFVLWRLDSDLVPKSHHVMWVFTLVSFPYFSLSILFICYLYHFIWPSDIFDQYDYPYHFIWHQWPTPYVFSSYEHLLASFHVLLIRRCWA